MEGRKIRNIGVAVLLMVLLIPVTSVTGEENQPAGLELYRDVPVTDSHFQNIAEARTLGMMTGYGDGTFQPYRQLTRSDVVKVLGKYIEQRSGIPVENLDLSGVEPFADVPPDYRDQELFQYSLLVKREGIFKGINNRLMPLSPMMRQQMAMVLVRAFDIPDLPGVQSRTTDNHLANGEEERRSIDLLSKHRITTVEAFRPKAATVRGHLASFLIATYHVVHEDYPPPEVVSIKIGE